MIQKVIVTLLLMLGMASAAHADPINLLGYWGGEAILNGDRTPIAVAFSGCSEGVCGELDLPEIGYARLPLGSVRESAPGQFEAGPLRVTLAESALSGTLSGHGGGLFLDAMGHGGEATVALARARPPRLDVREEEVAFQNGDVTLAGTLVRPRGRGRHPAIVALLGSGPAHRWYSLGRARAWARQGYAVLIYDKRGVGGSSGSWLESSLDDLADDAGAGVRFLAARSDIRADRIGFWAHSQGGWVGPRAVARGAPAAFLIAVSGGGATPRQVEWYGYRGSLDHMQVAGAERARAESLVERYFSYLSGDIDLAALRATTAEVRNEPWYRGLGIGRVIPTEEARGAWRWVTAYDPRGDIAALRIPTFIALAGGDDSTPLAEAVSGWSRALAALPAGRASLRVYAGSDHHQRLTGAPGWRRVNPDYERDLSAFLLQQSR